MRHNNISGLLRTPGFKVKVIICKTETDIHIRLERHKRKSAKCSGCGRQHKSKHSTRETIAEDVRLGDRRVFLHILKWRFQCDCDGRFHTEALEWIEKGARVTKAFGRQINRLTSITTNQEAGWFLGLNDEKIYRIDKAILERIFKERLIPTPMSVNISVDEVAWKKHHRYLTNVVDMDQRVVTWNAKGRKAEVLNRYYKSLGQESCERIASVAMDGAKTYIKSTKDYAVNAMIVLDRFHATQKASTAADMVRRSELGKARKNGDEELIKLTNCKQRFILLKNRSNLTENQSATLAKLCEVNQPIYQALLLKESFLQVYEFNTADEAGKHLDGWIEQAIASGLQSFVELAYSVKEKKKYVLNWYIKRISSAISEGFNNKIKRLKRMAYGYKDVYYFRLKIHQHCGYLNPRKFQLN
jgi:transposase